MAVFKSPNAPRKKTKWIKKMTILRKVLLKSNVNESINLHIPFSRKENLLTVLSTNSIQNTRNNSDAYINFHYSKQLTSRKCKTYGIKKSTLNWNYHLLWKTSTKLH